VIDIVVKMDIFLDIVVKRDSLILLFVIKMDSLSGDDSSASSPTQPRISSTYLARLPPPAVRGPEADIQVIFGSEDWHSTVPVVSVSCICVY